MQRYEAYKDSGVEWIGEIPAGWEVAPIKHLATCNDETLPEGTNGEYRFRYVDISAVSENSIGEYQEMRFRDAPSRARRVVRAGDVLVSTVRTYLKAIARVDDPENVISSTGFAVLRPRRIASRFFAYSLLNDCFAQVVSAYSVGISYPAINSSELVKLNLAVPGIAEQQAIADYLDGKTAEIDSIVSQTERSIGLLREYRKSVISEAVTKGLDPDAPMKDSGVEWIGEIPAGWDFSKIKYSFVNRDSERVPIEASSRNQSDGGRYPYYGASGIVDFIDEYIFNEPLLLLGEDGANLKMRNLPLVYLAKGKYWVNNHAHILQPKSNIDIRYMLNQLEMVDLHDFLTGMTMPKLTQEKLGTIPVVIPPLPEQQAIADYLDAKTAEIDSLIADKQRQVELLREYRKSLISEAVTGKFKVPGLE